MCNEGTPRYSLGGQCHVVGQKEEVLLRRRPQQGFRAVNAAGFMIVALTTTPSMQQLQDVGADWIVWNIDKSEIKGP